MEPEIKHGQKVLVSFIPFLFKKPKIGDIILFKNKSKDLVKKVNSIKGNSYFVIGVNGKDSLDSRKLGHILLSDILAKVIYKL